MKTRARTLRKSATQEETILWKHLRNNGLGVKFRRQVSINNRYVVDFVCLEKKLVIEIDGSQHAENVLDAQRTAYLKKLGFRVIRFWNNQINQKLTECLETIYQQIQESPSPVLRTSSPSRGEDPSPLEGEGGRSPDEGEI